MYLTPGHIMHRPPLACVLLLSLALTVSADASNRRLSAEAAFSDVTTRAFTPNGTRAVYLQDAQTDEVAEVWSVPIIGGTPVKLNAILGANEEVFRFDIAPDSNRVLYFAGDIDAPSVELYSSPSGGGPGTGLKLNDPLAAGALVLDAQVAANSARVVFAVSYDFSTFRELWSAKLDDTDLDALVTLPANREIDSYRITPDGAQVLYVAEAENGARELWRVPIIGGSPVLLSTDLPAGRAVTEFDVSPDGATVVFSANRDTVDRFALFRVAAGGGTPVPISAAFATSGRAGSPRFSPDGSRVLYIRQDPAGSARRLSSIEPDGDGYTLLNLLTGGLLDDAAFRISDDSQRAVFLAEQAASQFELFSTPLAGGVMVKLNGTLQPGGDVAGDFVIAPGSQRVVYRADEVVAGRSDLYSVPITGGQGTRLTPELEVCVTGVPNIDQLSFAVNAGGSQVFFSQCVDSILVPGPEAGVRLWSIPTLGGVAGRVDTCTLERNVARPFITSPVAPNQVLYVADQDKDEEFALYLGDTTCVFCDGFENAVP